MRKTAHGYQSIVSVTPIDSLSTPRQYRLRRTVYVIDQRGRVRYAWVGELAYEGHKGAEIVSAFVKTLLEER